METIVKAFRLAPDLAKRIDDQCEVEHRTFSNFIIAHITEYLESLKK